MSTDGPKRPRIGPVGRLRAAVRGHLGLERVWVPPEGASDDELVDDADETMVLGRTRDEEETTVRVDPNAHHRSGHRGQTLVPHPELAAAARRRVNMTRVGVVAALLGAVLMVVASVVRVDTQTDRLWSTAANVAAVLVLMIAVVQWRVWVAAWLEWTGVRSARLSPWLGMSLLGGWLSVVMALMEAFAGWRATMTPAAGDTATLLTWFALVCSVIGVVFAGLRSFVPGRAAWQNVATEGPERFSERG